MKLIFCLSLFLCPYHGFTQSAKALYIGDTLQGNCFAALKNYPGNVHSIADLHRPLVIIDFWSTTCSSCLEAFPKMHQLQEQFSDKLQIVAVNYVESDDAKKMATLVARHKKRYGTPFTLPYVLQDKILINRFPHQTIPHIVWLNGNGKVLAITEKEYVTAENITAALSGKPFGLPFKNDSLLFDAETENLAGILASKGAEPLYRSLITTEQPGKGSYAGWKTEGVQAISRYNVFNMPLMGLYHQAFGELRDFSFSRIVISKDAKPFFYADETKQEYKKYCYELLTSPTTRKKALEYLRADLQRYFNIAPVKKDSLMNCYVIRSTGSNEKIFTKGGTPASDYNNGALRMYLQNVPFDRFAGALNVLFKQPWIDETHITQNIDMEFPQGFFQWDITRINQWLQQFNLTIIEEPHTITIALLTTTTPYK